MSLGHHVHRLFAASRRLRQKRTLVLQKAIIEALEYRRYLSAPELQPSGDIVQEADEGQSVGFNLPWHDADNDPMYATVDWQDGTVDDIGYIGTGDGTVSATHNYDSGTYLATITVTDDNDESNYYDAGEFTVHNVAPTGSLNYSPQDRTLSFTDISDFQADMDAGIGTVFSTSQEGLDDNQISAENIPPAAQYWGRVTDKDGGWNDYEVDGAPIGTFAAGSGGPVHLGDTIHATFTDLYDPLDGSLHYSFATSPEELAQNYATASGSAVADFSFDRGRHLHVIRSDIR